MKKKGTHAPAKKKAHARAASSSRTQKGKPARKSKPPAVAASPRATKAPAKAGADPRRRGSPASFRLRPKRTFQVTDTLAKERVRFQAGKGAKPVSNTTSAREVLMAGASRAQKKFSRKKSGRFAARITLKWKSKEGKWINRSLVQISTSLEAAIDALLQHDEINSLTYEVKDEDGDTKKKKVGSKSKRIVNVSFDKYTERKYKRGKISKATKAKSKKKTTRNVRHRK